MVAFEGSILPAWSMLVNLLSRCWLIHQAERYRVVLIDVRYAAGRL